MDDDGFSGVVRIANVSDFIAPSQNCIIPLRVPEKSEPALVEIRGKNKEKKDGNEDAKLKAIKVSLNDCLACNGCVTSAETVLIAEQSLPRLLQGLRKGGDEAESSCCAKTRLAVVTLSPQSIASIAARRGWSMEATSRRLALWLKARGADIVLDSSFARRLSYLAAREEFRARSTLLLSGVCPGFVCYAEKSHSWLIPHLSKIRSPQAASGALVKDFMARSLKLESNEIFHAAVMPCFDKKLEASRPDFRVPGGETREVDVVVSSAELEASLDESTPEVDAEEAERGRKAMDEKLVEFMKGQSWMRAVDEGRLLFAEGGTSGGHAENVLRDELKRHPGYERITSSLMKNLEVTELRDSEGNVRLRVAKVYGFRNIQNLVRKMKTKKCDYDYVEVMACPSGCGNGGGQVRELTQEKRDEALRRVETLYEELKRKEEEKEEKEIENLMEEWMKLNSNWKKLLMTDYHVVDKNIAQITSLQW